jgi:hypothetical protein
VLLFILLILEFGSMAWFGRRKVRRMPASPAEACRLVGTSLSRRSATATGSDDLGGAVHRRAGDDRRRGAFRRTGGFLANVFLSPAKETKSEAVKPGDAVDVGGSGSLDDQDQANGRLRAAGEDGCARRQPDASPVAGWSTWRNKSALREWKTDVCSVIHCVIK